jgi:type I restriction enzyme, S subunit
MSVWQTMTLGEITDWFSGGTPSKQNESYWNGDIPWISAKTLKGTRVSDSEIKITIDGLSNGSRLAQVGDLLLLVRGSGLFNSIPISIVEKPVSFNQDIKAIRIKEEYNHISPWFLLYWLYGNKRILNGIMEETGIGAGKFDLGLLKDLTIELPPKEELKEITKTFKSIDDKIILLTQQNQTLEELAQVLFKRWFVEFNFPFDFAQGKPDENGQPYKESGGAMVESELGEIPEGWRVGTLEELVKFSNGKTSPYRVDEAKFPVFGSNGQIGTCNEHNRENIIIIGRVGSYCGSLFYYQGKCWVTDNAMTAEMKNSNNCNTFLFEFLKRADLNKRSTGSGQPLINQTILGSIELPIPTNNVIDKYSESASKLYKKISINDKEIQTLTQLRDTLLPKLMSGEIRINK